jgi:hypothetical protein
MFFYFEHEHEQEHEEKEEETFSQHKIRTMVERYVYARRRRLRNAPDKVIVTHGSAD